MSFVREQGEPCSLVRTFEKIVCMGEELKNEFDCPLLEKKERYIAIPTIDVVQSVSILHECTPTCTFSRKTHSTSIVERENIELNTLSIMIAKMYTTPLIFIVFHQFSH